MLLNGTPIYCTCITQVLRVIYRPPSINGEWRSKYNAELYDLYTYETIVQRIKVQRLRWLGHVYRMDNEVHAKKSDFSKPEGSRKRVRSKLRWLDALNEDLTKLRVKTTWKRKAANRNFSKPKIGCRLQRVKYKILILSAQEQLTNLDQVFYKIVSSNLPLIMRDF